MKYNYRSGISQFYFYFLFCLFLISCTLTFAQENDIINIKKTSTEFSQNYIKGDFQALANAYTDSALLFPPSRDVIVGRKAIFDFWKGLPSSSTLLSHRSEPERIIVSGNEAHDYGYYYTETQKSGESEIKRFSAKYYILWIKTDQGWKMKMDMWNSRDSNWNQHR